MHQCQSFCLLFQTFLGLLWPLTQCVFQCCLDHYLNQTRALKNANRLIRSVWIKFGNGVSPNLPGFAELPKRFRQNCHAQWPWFALKAVKHNVGPLLILSMATLRASSILFFKSPKPSKTRWSSGWLSALSIHPGFYDIENQTLHNNWGIDLHTHT